ncbi:contact-dependent growth inhibition system immunity protein [Streptomyces sp. NPDC017524]|uniref:contact-dependent growth inhibition system immunity protein n=1 Tax=unclassified Streptomyces TaxID=2593676 RepID=UPI0037AB29BD
MVDELRGHDAAVADYAATTNPRLVARLVGEPHELLALPLDEGDYALAAAELGMEVGPPEPFSHGAWFPSPAATLSGVGPGCAVGGRALHSRRNVDSVAGPSPREAQRPDLATPTPTSVVGHRDYREQRPPGQ